MAPPLRVRGSAGAGANAADLVVGRDLVLTATDAEALDLPSGALSDDYLSPAARREVDRIAKTALAEWQRHWHRRLEVDGIDLTWLLETELLADVFVRTVADVTAVRSALTALDPASVETPDGQPWLAAIVGAADPTRPVTTGRRETAFAGSKQALPLRRKVLDAMTAAGLPSLLRSRSVVLFGYWHLSPLFDRMLAERKDRPAVVLEALPHGPRRALSAAFRGGCVGRPGPLARRRLLGAVDRALANAAYEPFGGLHPFLERLLHARAVDLVRQRAGLDLARASTWRRAFRSRRPAWLVVPNDVMPDTRLAVTIARAAGVRSLVVQHGVYLPAPPDAEEVDDRIGDLETAGEVAVWSGVTGAAIDDGARTIHVIGYPLLSRVPVRPGAPVVKRLRVLVLVQTPERVTVTTDARMSGTHARVAARAVLARYPDAFVTLRPHPSRGSEAMERIAKDLQTGAVSVDVSTEIHDLVQRHDVCIGAKSTASFQAALGGAKVVILNLTGTEWKWPLGGDTPVLVARSEDELEEHLVRVVSAGNEWPGRAELIDTLGAPYGDGTERLLEILRD